MGTEHLKNAELRQKLIQGLNALDSQLRINNHPESSHLPHAVSVSFSKHRIVELQNNLSHLGFSSGSACSSGEMSGSPVLKAVGLSDEIAQRTIRLSLGRWTTESDVVEVLQSFSTAFELADQK
jgi:cysteine desulfurase